MSHPMPPQIEVRELLPNGVRYCLPPRPIGAWRFVGLAPVLFAMLVAGMPASFVIAASRHAPIAFIAVFSLFVLPFLWGAWKMVRVGLLILSGHSEIELDAGHLRAIERAGPIVWRRARLLNAVERFELDRIGGSQAAGPVSLPGLSALSAQCGGAKPFLLALGYPTDWLSALADDLARRCNVATPERILAPQKIGVETVVVSKPAAVPPAADRAEQPPGSRVVLDRQPGALTLTLPPLGLWHGNRGLLVFGVAWCAMTAAFTAAVVAAARNDTWVWPALLFLLLFRGVGIGLLIAAVRIGRRQAMIRVIGDRLMIAEATLRRIKTREWSREDLAALCAGPSGMEVNNVPVIELQLHPRIGRKVGLLAGRDRTELEWLATILRQELRVPAARRD